MPDTQTWEKGRYLILTYWSEPRPALVAFNLIRRGALRPVIVYETLHKDEPPYLCEQLIPSKRMGEIRFATPQEILAMERVPCFAEDGSVVAGRPVGTPERWKVIPIFEELPETSGG